MRSLCLAGTACCLFALTAAWSHAQERIGMPTPSASSAPSASPPQLPGTTGTPPATSPRELLYAPPALSYNATAPANDSSVGGRWWGSIEYLGWFIEGDNYPPLVTGSPLGTPLTQAGVLTAPNTSILFGNDEQSTGYRNGLRFEGGYWLDDEHSLGLDYGFFFLFPNTSTYSFSSPDGSSIIARPFFNGFLGVQDSAVISYPGVVAGSITSIVNSSDLYGLHATARVNRWLDGDQRIDLLLGYRFVGLREDLAITEVLQPINPVGVVPGTKVRVFDQFRATNQFHGAQAGVAWEGQFGAFYVNATGKLAVGVSHQVVEIAGNTIVAEPGTRPTFTQGGLLAQRTNIGYYSRNQGAVLPELDLRLGYHVTEQVRAFIGYSFLYWSSVSRPGNQLDLTVNTTQIPPGTLVGPARPAPLNVSTDFWAQGLTAGFEVRY